MIIIHYIISLVVFVILTQLFRIWACVDFNIYEFLIGVLLFSTMAFYFLLCDK